MWDAQRIWQESQVDSPGPEALGIFGNALTIDNLIPKSDGGECAVRPKEDGKFEISLSLWNFPQGVGIIGSHLFELLRYLARR